MYVKTGIAVVFIVLSAGCIGVESFESEKPVVDESTVEQHNYEEYINETVSYSENLSIIDQTLDIEAHAVGYSKSIGDAKLNITEEQLENADMEKIINSLSSIESESGDTIFTDVESIYEKDEEDNGSTSYDNIDEMEPSEVEQLLNEEFTDHPVSSYTVTATPKIEILDQDVNPVGFTETDEVIEVLFNDLSEDIEIDKSGNITIETENSNSISVYDGSIQDSGLDKDVSLYVYEEQTDNTNILSFGIVPVFVEDEETAIVDLVDATDVIEASATYD